MANEHKLREYLKWVTEDLRQTRERLRRSEEDRREPIAIVAMGCRFPGGVRTPEDLWRLVSGGVDATGEFPTDRGWDLDALYDPDPERRGTTYCRRGGFLYDAAEFDPAPFGMSPREALATDPQQRLLLETSWEVFERAGLDLRSLAGTRAGVFVGAAALGYGSGLTELPEGLEGHLLIGNATSLASGRIAYTFGLEGPAVTVDTACSSSLVALHLAAQALRAGECDLALAGGVSVMSSPTVFVEFSHQRGLSPDGRCRSFAEAAAGTGWAEGVGLLLVERLSDARANGHPVLAVLAGSAVNSDGTSNGLTAPNGPSQQRVIRDALASGGLTPSDVDAVEAHGTGTRLGDPIEAQAILATYGQDRDIPLLLGALKSNIGHAQAAAGVGGVIKMVMALRAGQVPATLHVDRPTSAVDWSTGAVELITGPRAWPETGRVRRAAVSAFGISGTNAHVVLAQLDTAATDPADIDPVAPASGVAPMVVWLLAGRGAAALRGQAARLAAHLVEHPEQTAAQVAAGLRARAALDHRAVVLGVDPAELAAGVRSLAREADDGAAPGTGIVVRGVAEAGAACAFLFAGQGSQRAGMGVQLAREFPVFGEVFSRLCERLGVDTAVDDVDRTVHAQAGLFALKVALFHQLAAWGVRPDAVAGHSVGEVAAAHVAGVLSEDDAIALVAARGRLMQELPGGGAMVAIPAAAEQVRPLLRPGVDLAAINGPRSVVISGDEDAVTALAARFERTRRLTVSHAFHSHRMEPMLERFRAAVANLTFAEPGIPFVCTGDPTDPDYWVNQVRDTVRFHDTLTELAEQGITRFVELGPDATLTPLVETGIDQDDVVTVALQRRDQTETRALLTGLARLHVHGTAVDWSTLIPPAGRVELPTYAFQRTRFWLESGGSGSGTGASAEWRYREVWRTVPLEQTPLSGRWVTVGVPTDLVTALRAAGAEVSEYAPDGETGAGAAPGLTGIVAMAADAEQALAVLRAASAPVWLITRGAVDAGARVSDPVAAGVWGLGRVAALEIPDRFAGLIDLPETPDPDTWRRVCVVVGQAGETEVALRGSGVLARRLVTAPTGAAESGWQPSGTVLVTGGTGALGRHVAGWLVARGARQVVLAARGGHADWAGEPWTAGRVRAVSCDVTDRAALAALLAGLEDLTGVVHAAGVLDDGVLDALTPDRLAAVRAPKADAALALHELTLDRGLGAFVLFSSMSGALGAPGQGGYAAANAVLDALARQRRADGRPALSIAWGPWAGSGMAADPAVRARLHRAGTRPLDPTAATDALAAALDSGDDALVVADLEWARFGPAYTGTRPTHLFDELPAAATSPAVAAEPTWARLIAAGGPRQRRATALRLVRGEVATVLGHTDLADVEPRRGFADLGFDSLTAVELRNRLRRATGLALAATVVFDHPTPAALADHLVAGLGGGAPAGDGAPSDPAPGTAETSTDPLAIVALSCRFPGGVDSPEALWDVLAAGADVIGGFPTDRGWDLEALYDPDPDHPGTSYARHGGFVAGVGDFDAELFGISPREALAMDPRQRLVLELTWELIERAGIDPAALRGSRTGVFLGSNGQDYAALMLGARDMEGHIGTGTADSVVSGRVAYTFGLAGPAITVDTACSSSLVAVHLAGQALRSGECDLAVVGGATVMSTPGAFVEFSRQRGLAPDGRCKPFAEAADGTGWAEGAGLLLLERLSDARRRGHPVLAVVAGSAVNSDGASNGLTAPHGPAQQRVIQDALAAGGLHPADVDAIEAHGTGTTLGDPIEAQALQAVYGRDRATPVWLGSVKSNLGHTQAAAGAAGIIKMVLALRHETLPATLHVDAPSRHVDWGAGAVELLTEARPWPSGDRVRRAGVSSFGVSGTNAHVVLEQALLPAPSGPARPAAGAPAGPPVIPYLFSAAGETALLAQARRLRDWLTVQHPHGGHSADAAPLDGLAAMMARSRAALRHRAAVLADGPGQLLATLDAYLDGHRPEALIVGEARLDEPTALLFSGQGSQRPGMGQALAAAFPLFGEVFERLSTRLRVDTAVDDLDRTVHTQAGLFALEVALYRQLDAWGVHPDAVAGHSIGEVAAAHVAGVLSEDDAVTLVRARGRLLQDLPPGGAMVALPAAERDVRPLLGPGVDLAAVNGPRSVVISGDEDAVAAVAARFDRPRRLAVSHAFHSHRVVPMLAEFRAVVATLRFAEPELPLVCAGDPTDPEYWVAQIRDTVRFGDTLDALTARGITRFVELGPDAALTPLVAAAVPDHRTVVVPLLRRDREEPAALRAALAQLHVHGILDRWPDPAGPSEGPPADAVPPLPTYAFQRRRYWPRPRPAVTGDPRQAWTYREEWVPVTLPPAAPTGDWLLLGAAARDTRLRAALTAGGARAHDDPTAAGEWAGVLATPRDEAELLAVLHGPLPAPLWCLTRDGIAPAEDAEDPSAAVGGPAPTGSMPAAAIWGLGRVAALELPRQWGGLLDLPARPTDTDLAAALAALAQPDQDQLVVRAGTVRARRIVPATASGRDWRPRGTVLVTGGTGALGEHVTCWLLEHGADHVVLVGRGGTATWLDTPDPDRAELFAGRVRTVACDVTDRAALTTLLAGVDDLRSVIHAAGLGQATPLAEMTDTELAEVEAAKVTGARHLDELTRDRDLDAFVLFSSVAATWGSGGQGGYAAANAALEALARDRRAAGRPATALAWGPWDGTGMAAGPDAQRRLRDRGLRPMDPDIAVEALGRALDRRAVLVVADVDWARFVPGFTAARPSPLLDEIPEARTSTAGPPAERTATAARLAALPPAQRGEAVSDLVAEAAAAALGHDAGSRLPADRAFRELGFDSLTAVDLRNRLVAATGAALPTTTLFDHPTVAALARHLDEVLTGTAAEPPPSTAAVTLGADTEPIAVLGMACRLPGGVRDPDGFWDLLVSGGDAITPFPDDRGWDLAGLYDPDPDHAGTSYARHGGFLDAAAFDADFFGISPHEALAMDPQQRLLLETAWEAVEHAGMDPSTLRGGDTGVFVGASASGYAAGLRTVPEGLGGHLLTGGASSVVSGRIAYSLGLTGPSMTVDTACSSSLVALHLAAQALRRGECSTALVGGVAVIATPAAFVEFSRQRGLAPDGRCKPFAAAADGTGWSEGAGVLMLARLSEARRAGYPVLAVVRGSAVNSDGASNGLTAPSGTAQERVIRAALASAGLDPAQVDAVEGHGTGTSLGDPIEARAVLSAYGRDRVSPLWLGSVKSNLGHTQAAAGVTGVIKMVLALRHELMPRSLHLDAPTPHVDWAGGGVHLLTEDRPWPVGDHPRRVGVSAFGVSGTNAHVVLEEAPTPEPATPGPATYGPVAGPGDVPVPLIVSGHTPGAREAQLERLRAFLAEHPDLPRRDVALALATTRTRFAHGVAVHGSREIRGRVTDGRTAFVFSGQGSQRAGMGQRLAAVFPVFGEVFGRLCARLGVDTGADDVHRTVAAQAGLFAFEVALFRQLASWGVRPDAVAGHSIGEIAAAHVAGVFSEDAAVQFVRARGTLMQALPPGGAMVAIPAPAAEVRPWLGAGAELAAVNGPASVVVSGDEAAVAAVAARFDRSQRLSVSHAFHSARMEPVLARLAAVAAGLRFAEPQIPLVCAGEPTDPAYWVRQVRDTVRFHDAVTELLGRGVTRFVELGPDAALTPLLDGGDAAVIPLQRRDRDEAEALLAGLAQAHLCGVGVDWLALLEDPLREPVAEAPDRARPVIPLPTYAFQHERFWLEVPTATGGQLDHPLLGGLVTQADTGATLLMGTVSARTHPWLADHSLGETPVLPTAAVVELALAAASLHGRDRVEELTLLAPVVLPADTVVHLQVQVDTPDARGTRAIAVYARPGADLGWTRHAEGLLGGTDEPDEWADAWPDDWPDEWPPREATEVATGLRLETQPATGRRPGPGASALGRVWTRGRDVFAEVRLPDPNHVTGFELHPLLLDAALHPLGLDVLDGVGRGRIVFTLTAVRLTASSAAELRVRLTRTGEDTVTLAATDPLGGPVLTTGALRLRPAPAAPEPATPVPAVDAPDPIRRPRRAASADPGLAARVSALDEPGQRAQLTRLVQAAVARVLGHTEPDNIDESRSFADLGFTSLTAVELRNALGEATGLRLPATLVFDYPTASALAAHLRTQVLDLDERGARPVARPAHARPDEPIAILGMACRYPGGVETPEQLWDLVAAGGDGVSGLPTDRGWDLTGLYHPDPDNPGTSYAREGGFLHDASRFDAAFFGISPREATSMDPQQRLLLETAWEALERGGIDPKGLRGSDTGVFAGVTYQDYAALLVTSEDSYEGLIGTGNSPSVLSGRIAFTLGLEGPAVTVDTACSSSLVALHLAAQSLRQGDCSLALAGGITVMSTPGAMVEYSRQRALAPDGRCKPFSADADGAGWAEGAGLLLVARLSDARRLGHPVLAVLRGSAVNSDGASNGLTAPNGPSQQRVIRHALAAARLRPRDVDVVEAHGTGTTLGDPIEAQAVIATYGQDRDEPVWLGSLKSNIGHSQAASGVGGVIKMVHAMRHGLMPRSLHLREPSPHVDWSAGAVELLAEQRLWERRDRPRRAAVSSFGVSGTNAHVVLEEYQADAPADPTPADPERAAEPVPLMLSAADPAALRAQAERLLAWLDGRPGEPVTARPVDLAHTLLHSRTHFAHRAGVVGATIDELRAGLCAVAQAVPAPHVVTGRATGPERPIFVFPGQGAQWAGMAVELLDTSPVFAERMAECCAALAEHVDFAPLEVLRSAREVERADVVQPLSWAVMVSLAALWESHGIRPAAVVGHSQGEIAAACVAGALSLADGARVVALRSRAIAAIAGLGGMVSVPLPRDEVEALLGDTVRSRVSVAAVNGPEATVVSGDPAVLDQLLSRVGRARRIAVDYASHSAQVDSLRERILADLAPITPGESRVPFISTVTGDAVAGTALDAGYWFTNLRSTVLLEPVIRDLARRHRIFLEVSPHPVLAGPIAATAPEAAVIGTLRRDEGGLTRFRTSLAELSAHGAEVDWEPVFAGRDPRRVDLPTYAFQRRRFWPTAAAAPAATAADPVDARFWTAVERGELAGELAIDPDTPLHAVMPTLTGWRAERRERAELDSWRYRISWKPVRGATRPRLVGTWLVLSAAGHTEPVEPVLGALRAAGAEARHVAVPDATERTALAELLAGLEPVGVLSLLGTHSDPHPEHPSLPGALWATVALVQALGDLDVAAPLWVATTGAVSVGADDVLTHPLRAAIWGLGRVVGLEHPERWGGLVDLPEELDERAGRRLAAALAGIEGEDQLAVRRSGIYVRRLLRAPAAPDPVRDWRPTGSVLVTGGTGALGRHLARWLARAGAPHLVLTSRRGLDADGVVDLRDELRELGAEVTVAACDAADREAMAAVLAALPANRPLSAVVHAAGVLDDHTIAALTPEQMVGTLRPKIDAAVVLHELTRELDLTAFVVFSSTAATLGGPGQGNYAPGNAFLDALAEHRRALGLPATAVAWGTWAGGGMAGRDAAVSARMARGGVFEMSPGRALEALGRTLDRDETTLTVADIGWDRFAPGFAAARPRPVLDDLPDARRALDTALGGGSAIPSAVTTPLSQQLAQAPAGERDTVALTVVRTFAAGVLGHGGPEDVDPERPFAELGFDSLTALEFRNALSRGTGLTLPATLIFDYPTPVVLAAHLRAEVSDDAVVTDAPPTRGGPVVADTDPVVIVGMACRFPGGVATPEQLWEVLVSGGDVIGDFPADRGWDLEALWGSGGSGADAIVARQGGFLTDVAGFDADFFEISPREALSMDPQQRLLLEASWEAVERSGINPRSLHGSRTGVFAGSNGQDYVAVLLGSQHGADGYGMTGNAGSVVSGRVAYALGLEGPAVTVDTACSSSLVAMHWAAQSLRAGECDLALAGGVTVMSTPGGFADFSRQGGLSVDGRCKAFAGAADGTGWSEGVGVLVLERLSRARDLNHQVLAVLAGSAINSDGASNGLTAPNGPAQQRVIRDALAAAGLQPAEVDVVEAHGTGTTLGDPIEAQALLAAYGRDRGTPLWLGSVKSNIGHTQAAAGVAGVIKMVLALRHATLPATLHVDEPTPHVDWSGGAVRLLTEQRKWPTNGHPRRFGVSSFGISGTNAHAILAEPPVDDRPPPPLPTLERVVPWVLSGRTREVTEQQLTQLNAFLDEHHPDGTTGADGLDVAYSLATTRAAFEHRVALVEGRVLRGERAGGGLGFVFSGQGSQRPGMGRQLHAIHPVFADAWDEACSALRLDPWGVELDRTEHAQPALFAFELALFRLLESWGIRPDQVAGHSVGELVAAHVAGVFSLTDAARLVHARGRLMQALPEGGAMVAVSAGEHAVAEFLGDGVDLAAVNAPEAVVLSGDEQPVLAAARALSQRGHQTHRLRVGHAFHSARMEPMLAQFAEVAHSVDYAAPTLRVLSEGDVTDPEHWVRHIRATVRFHDLATGLRERGARTLLEIGPDAALTSVIDLPGCTVIPTQRRSHAEDTALAQALAQLHVRGVNPDWAAYFDGTGARRVDLPTYPFQHREYWPVPLDRTATDVTTAGLTSADHPLLGAAVELADTDGFLFTARLARNTHRWLTDHVVSGRVLLPGTAFLELALRAAEQAGCPMVREFTLAAPVALPEHGAVALQVSVSAPDDTDHRTITLYSRPEPDGHTDTDTSTGDTPWTLHASGVLGPDRTEGERFAQWPPPGAEAVAIEEFYPRFAELGFDHGPVFQGLRSVWRAGSDIYAEVALDESTADTAGRFGMHPALLDAALHAVAFVSLGDAERGRLPFSWQGATLHATGASALRVRLSPVGPDAVSITATDPIGAPVLTVESLLLRQMSDTPPADRHPTTDGLYELAWAPAPTPATTDDDQDPVPWALLGDDPFELSDPARGEHPAPEVLVRCLGPGQGVREALEVVQEFLGSATLGAARLAVVTGDPTTDPDIAAVWGLVRSAEVENPGHFLLIGLDHAAVHGAATPGPDPAVVFGEALATAVSTGEPQLLVRAGVVHVARLVRAGGADIPVPARGPWRLHVDERGSLDNLVAVPAESAPLQPGQVRIGVRAAGVNFRDVLTTLDMYPGEAALLGTEVAGVVTELAPDVTGLAVGDRVMGMAFGGFGPQVVTDRRLLTHIPPGWTFAQAAATPTAFLTAFYALVDLGRVRPGERVLIHAAAGGVGMAASQLARHLGARLFGTASPGKWAATGLAEDRLASSRDTGFAAAFGQVDVVLNSLAGPFIDASLGMLGDGGRFLEMGKTDLRDTTPDGVDYRPFDLWDAGIDRIGQMLGELAGLFTAGVLQPLPLRCWDVRRARDAFRHISQARHIGKVVLTVPAPLDPERPILITGGTGALGLELAHHLVTERGARRPVLTSRRGPHTPGTAASVAALANAGARVEVLACDVTDHDQLTALLAERDWTAIVHTAGVLADATLPTQTGESLDTALAPKIHAATHLDHLTRHHDLAVFAVYSSIAGTLGSAGQANYAAANAALDALATRRRAAGLPATSLAWGPWAPTTGMTATLTSTHRTRLTSTGLRPIPPRRGAELFDAGVSASGPTVVVADIDHSTLRRWGPPHLWRNLVGATPRRATARPGANTAANAADTAGGLRGRLAGLSGEEREQLLLDVVCEQVAAVLGHESAASVDPDRPFSELGFDSLTAVELRNRLGALTGERLPATLVFNHPRPTALAAHLGTEVLPERTAPDVPEPSSIGGQRPARDAVPAPPELAQVAAALADPSRRASVAEGLRDLLERWTDLGEREGAEATAPGVTSSDHDDDSELEAATPDDIFDLVDRELRKL